MTKESVWREIPEEMALIRAHLSDSIIIAAILMMAVMVGCPAFSQQEPAPSSVAEIQGILRQRVDVENRSVGIVVGLIDAHGKRIVGHGRIGNAGTRQPDGDTVFEIGSVTKVFTSLLLADFVQHSEVELNDPGSKFLPDSVKMPTRDGREITLADLATHTSGLPRMPSNLRPKDALNPYADYSVEQMYAALSNTKLNGNIGEKYEYSNLATGLLGHLLALRAGTDYETLIRTRVCKPLAMTSTMIKLTPDAQQRLAAGHNEMLDETPNWDLPTLAGTGAIRSTASDMLKFVEACMGLTKTSLDSAILEQLKIRKSTGIPDLQIALGWHISTKYHNELVFHNGQTGGYHSFIGFDKKRGVGVVVLANTATDIDDIGMHLLDARHPLKKYTPFKKRTTIKLDPKILQSYLGEYVLAPTFVMAITQDPQKEGRLFVQATGQPKFEIFPETETKFFLKVVEAQISFVKDDKGEVTQLILHQNGLNQPGQKRKR